MTMVTIGKIGKPFGVHGWLVVYAYTDPIDNILTYQPWQLQRDDRIIESSIRPEAFEVHHQHIVCQFAGCHTPEDARYYTHTMIMIDRAQLPPLAAGEYYWGDLVGHRVINESQDLLGTVSKVDNHGPHDLFYVQRDNTQYTIPYVDAIVQNIDMDKKTIEVIWPLDATS